jgi:hypothetical protein
MLNALLNIVIGCSHRTTSFPLTPRQNRDSYAGRRKTYVACLECGKEFEYDWQEMRIRKAITAIVTTTIAGNPVQI